ncbi:MAG: hypothetical protein A2026_01025 [Deltaproteobacteria bacterium RBG_19FT_COMBO_46_12]|nr:MAG: hypothetical protein A2026_01025 [Deltaproteobacteria bacterium RBG_19FT_COMBO_46_12]
MKHRVLLALLCVCCLFSVVSVFLLASAATPPPTWPKSISIAAAPVGTGNYSLAAGMANLVAKYTGVRAVPEASSVGGRTLHQLNNKDVEFAISFCDQAYEAARGLGEYKKYGAMHVRQLWMGTVAPLAMVTHNDLGIKTFADLKGKKVMSKYSGNLTFGKVMDLFLEGEGMPNEDINHIAFTGWKDGATALKEKRIAAFIHPMPSEGMPSWLKELSFEIPVRLFSIEEKKIDFLANKYKYVTKCKLSAKDYGDITYNKDLVTISPYNSMFCRADLPDDLVYAVMKAVFDHLSELYPYHKDVKEWTDNPLYPAVVPYHPGVIQYWREKGRWTVEMDKLQRQLLTEVGASR